MLAFRRWQLERTEYNYKWESWGFAMTNRVEGFDGVTDTTEWTYYTSGNGKGQVKTEKRQSGLLIQYAYDNVDRVISETRSAPDMTAVSYPNSKPPITATNTIPNRYAGDPFSLYLLIIIDSSLRSE